MVYFRAALVRLLWFALRPRSASTAMPAGWVHGRLGEIVVIAAQASDLETGEVEHVLTRLLDGDKDGFTAWLGERTQTLAHAHDLAIRDADLETVGQFMQAKARRSRPFTVPDQTTTEPRMDSPSWFTDKDGNPP